MQSNNLPPVNEALVAIMGRPNFLCASVAQALRLSGRDIPRKSEHEQAHTIHFLLNHYLADPENWQANANAELNAICEAQRDGNQPKGQND